MLVTGGGGGRREGAFSSLNSGFLLISKERLPVTCLVYRTPEFPLFTWWAKTGERKTFAGRGGDGARGKHGPKGQPYSRSAKLLASK